MQAQIPPPHLIHYHHAWLIWVLFFFGQFLHLALQVDDISRKNKLTRKQVINFIGTAVAVRTFFAAMIFGLIWHDPTLIADALKAMHINIGGEEAGVLEIPMNNFIAGLYGILLDSILGYIPGLKSWLPEINGTPSISVPQAKPDSGPSGAI